MSIFDTIKNAIFGNDAKADEAHPTTTAPSTAPASGSAATEPSPTATPEPGLTAPYAAAPQATNAGDVDVAKVLDEAAAKSGQTLDWRHSIVDLLKALGIDSSLSNRQELGGELGYHGDKHDSASLNVWLHKQVLEKLKANGGKVPAELA